MSSNRSKNCVPLEGDELTSELERIKAERERVRDRLNEIRPRRKRERDGDDNFGSRFEGRDNDSKRRIIPSVVAVSDTNENAKTENSTNNPSDEIVINDEVRERRKAAIESQKSNTNDRLQSRNRRMFGNLLGHLNQAKTILTKDQSLFDRQRKLEQDVIEREKKESEIIRSVQNQVKKEEAEKELNRLNELQMEERMLRLKKSLQNRCNRFNTLGRYCLTNTEPQIYWLPANGNAQTDEYLEKSKKRMEEKCVEEKKRVACEIEAIETQKKMREEREQAKRLEEVEKEEKMEEEKEEAPKVDSKMLNLNSDSEDEKEEKPTEKEEKPTEKEEKPTEKEEKPAEKEETPVEKEEKEPVEEKMEEEPTEPSKE